MTKIESLAVIYPNKEAHNTATTIWAQLTSGKSDIKASALPACVDSLNRGPKKWSHHERLAERKQQLRRMGQEAVLIADLSQTDNGKPTLHKRSIADVKVITCLKKEDLFSTVILPYALDEYEFESPKHEKAINALQPVEFEAVFDMTVQDAIESSPAQDKPIFDRLAAPA